MFEELKNPLPKIKDIEYLHNTSQSKAHTSITSNPGYDWLHANVKPSLFARQEGHLNVYQKRVYVYPRPQRIRRHLMNL